MILGFRILLLGQKTVQISYSNSPSPFLQQQKFNRQNATNSSDFITSNEMFLTYNSLGHNRTKRKIKIRKSYMYKITMNYMYINCITENRYTEASIQCLHLIMQHVYLMHFHEPHNSQDINKKCPQNQMNFHKLCLLL